MAAPSSDLYEAVLAVSRAIGGRTDLQSLLSGLTDSLRRIINFDYLALMLHDPTTNVMRSHVLNEPGPGDMRRGLSLPVEDDPAGWVWQHQQTLVVRPFGGESRWPGFIDRARSKGLHALTVIPLTVGDNRLGALGFGSVATYDPSAAEIAFLERVASEFAVAIEAFVAKQALVRERDRLRTLFDITNAIVSKLSPDELFTAISEQLLRVTPHEYAAITLCNEETGGLDLYTVRFTGRPLFDEKKRPLDPKGMPTGQAIATGKPIVVDVARDVERYPSPDFRVFVEAGFKSGCVLPLKTRNRTIGTLGLARTSDTSWQPEDVDFLVQVAGQIAIALENAIAFRELSEIKDRLASEKLYLEEEIRLDNNVGSMVGQGPGFEAVLKSIQIVAPTDATVLILGETGTGKELVARAIHDLSQRVKNSFVKVNCAAIPGTLIESELFGHEKGAFTGAVGQKIGRFELAHHGTLFLDEIGEMPLELQPKLLRAIQDQEFERVGGTRTIRTDVRFIAATNRDLKGMVEQNRFRADLYYRLHVFPLNIPPLRDRREDIPLLARYFVQKYAHRLGRNIERIPTTALDALMQHDWPGNIRELQNVIERSVILSNGGALHVSMPEFRGNAVRVPPRREPSEQPDTTERARILEALKEAKGLVGGPNGAAARLGIKRTTLQSRMRKLNIARQFG